MEVIRGEEGDCGQEVRSGMNSGESINQGALGAPLAEETERSKFYERSHG
jgi:hypothetical protein